MIVIRTKHDTPTKYLFVWTESIISEAEQKGFDVYKIEGPKVNFKNFEKRIKKIKPSFVFFNGHGTKSSFWDNNKEELINLESSHLLKGTVTYARACSGLIELGADAVKEGCRAFIGYKKRFWIPRWHKTTCRPLKDLAAKPVLECSNLVASQLLRRKTVKEAIEKSHEQTDKEIVDLIYSQEPFASAALAALIHNDSALDFEGKPSARIN